MNMTDPDIFNRLNEGKWIDGFDPAFGPVLQKAETMCFQLNSLPPADQRREEIIKSLLGKIGDRHVVHSPFRCDFGFNISIGEDFISNFNLTILDEAQVTIGNNVFIGPNVSIYTVTHALLPEQRNIGLMKALPITIGDNVWIGGNVTILSGVSIGNGSVIGAGSVVRDTIPAGVLAAGNPCRVIRPITEKDVIRRE